MLKANSPVFGVTPTMIVHTKKPQSDTHIFLYLLTSLPKKENQEVQTSDKCIDLLFLTVNSLFQPSDSSTLALNQTFKKPTWKAACIRQSDQMKPPRLCKKCVQ